MFLFFKFAQDIFLDQNLYYYTFSTIIQGFLALVALLGAVVIYKLQIIENDLNKISDKVEIYVAQIKGAITKTYSWIETMNECQRILSDSADPNSNNGAYIKMCFDKMQTLSNNRGDIRSHMVDFSLLSFLNIGLALFGLPISKLLVVNSSYYIGTLYLMINILISCISMFFAWKVVRVVMGYSFKVHL